MKILVTMLMLGNIYILNASINEKNNNKQWVKDLKALVLMSNKSTINIKGNDKNNNGVRDDVERYIWSKYENDKFQRDMFFTAAKTIQKILTLPTKSNKKEHIVLDKKLLEIYTCRDYILYRNESENIEQEMLNKTLFKGKVLNTPERLKAYIDHKRVLPTNLQELTEEDLIKDKNSCLSLYFSYKNDEKKSTVSIIR
jgi:hypothetical protein